MIFPFHLSINFFYEGLRKQAKIKANIIIIIVVVVVVIIIIIIIIYFIFKRTNNKHSYMD
jgi:predicted permease